MRKYIWESINIKGIRRSNLARELKLTPNTIDKWSKIKYDISDNGSTGANITDFSTNTTDSSTNIADSSTNTTDSDVNTTNASANIIDTTINNTTNTTNTTNTNNKTKNTKKTKKITINFRPLTILPDKYFMDKSARPHTLGGMKLYPIEEEIIIFIRTYIGLSIRDISNSLSSFC